MTHKLKLDIVASFPPKEGEVIEIILTETTGQLTSFVAYIGTIYEPVFEVGYTVAEIVEASADWKRGTKLGVSYRLTDATDQPEDWDVGTITFNRDNIFDTDCGTYSTLVEAVGFMLEKRLDDPPPERVSVYFATRNEISEGLSKVLIIAAKPIDALNYRDTVQIQWWQGANLLDETNILMTGLSISQQLGSEIYFNPNLKSFWSVSSVELYYVWQQAASSHGQSIGLVEVAGPNEHSYSELEPDEVVTEIIQDFLYVNLPS